MMFVFAYWMWGLSSSWQLTGTLSVHSLKREDIQARGDDSHSETDRTANSWRWSVDGPAFRRRFRRIDRTLLILAVAGCCETIASAACAATFVSTRSAASST